MRRHSFFSKLLTYSCIFWIFAVSVSPFQYAFAQNRSVAWAEISANGDLTFANRRIGLIAKTLNSIYFPFSFSGLSVFLDVNQKEPRGQFRGKEMKLSATVDRDSEFIKLFTHELGHFIDIYVLRATNTTADPSESFYAISWKSANVKKPANFISDFISGYAATNQYEDFAEAFVWYIFHNENFHERAMKNDAIRQKYLFFADFVFVHGEFQGTDFSLGQIPNYFWDSTKIPIFIQNYLSFLG